MKSGPCSILPTHSWNWQQAETKIVRIGIHSNYMCYIFDLKHRPRLVRTKHQELEK